MLTAAVSVALLPCSNGCRIIKKMIDGLVLWERGFGSAAARPLASQNQLRVHWGPQNWRVAHGKFMVLGQCECEGRCLRSSMMKSSLQSCKNEAAVLQRTAVKCCIPPFGIRGRGVLMAGHGACGQLRLQEQARDLFMVKQIPALSVGLRSRST